MVAGDEHLVQCSNTHLADRSVTVFQTVPTSSLEEVDGTSRWFYEAQNSLVSLQIFLSSTSASEAALSDYGRSKFYLESLFIRSNEVVFRLGLVVGDGGFFQKIVNVVKRALVVPLLGRGKQKIQYIGISRVVDLISQCIEREGKGFRGRIWNLHEEFSIPLKEAVILIKNRLNSRGILLPVPVQLALWVLVFFEKVLQKNLPISSSNVRGFIQQGDEQFPSDLSSLGYSAEEFQVLVDRYF